MSILTFLFRLILFLFVFRLAGIVLRSFFGGFFQGARQNPEPVSGADPRTQGQIEELVKDPVCGVHTARSSAILGRYRGSPAHFCSEECAEKAKTI